jgi:hypothetical protein
MKSLRAGPVAAVAVAAVAAVVVGATPAYAASSTLFRITDHRVDEASGIARGIASPGVFYVQNDSGDSARFFALDARSGAVRAVYSVPGAKNVDWEDLAVTPDAGGTPSVWLADIGDNDGVRDEVQLYRVNEPHVDLARTDVAAQTARPDVWRLRYPSGPVNAESLAVDPHGRGYLITKSDTGRSVVYAVPPRPDPDRVQTMRRIGAITLESHGGLIPSRLQVLATGAALSADGSLLAVRTYTDAYVWRVRHGDVAAAIRAAPTRVSIPLQPQGEGIAFDGSALVLDSESVGAAVYRVPLPPALAGSSSPPSPSSSVPSSASSIPSPAPSDLAAPHSTGSHATLIVLGGVVLALGLGVAIAMRRRSSGE